MVVVARLMPVTASVAIHVALVGSIALLPAWTAPQEPVVILELVEPETPPAPVAPSPPPKRDPRPLTAPKPIVAPRPEPPRVESPSEKPVEPPPPPRVETPPEPVKPAPAPPAPVIASNPAAAAAPAPASPPPASATTAPGRPGGASTFTAGAAPATRELVAPSGPAMAALPSDGITQGAVPREGYHPRPPYPRSARDKRIEGTTLLRVLVNANGRVGDVVVRESAGHPDLDEAAASTIRTWRFEPARRGREAVAVWVELPVVFTMKR